MFKLSAVLTSLVFGTFAYAKSLHPCTPIVEAQDTGIFCTNGKNSVSITIHALTSPAIEMCEGENYYEYKTAEVTLKKGAKTQFLYDGEFEYTLSPIGDATFVSDKLKLNLTKCVIPILGAVSFGN